VIETEFDMPDDVTIPCEYCGQLMQVTHFWLPSRKRWALSRTVHDECMEKSWKKFGKPVSQAVPERFQGFDPTKFGDQAALEAAMKFQEYPFRTIAIIGEPGKGKSRLMWYVVQLFFTELAKFGQMRWCDYWIFPDLVTDFDNILLRKVKESGYAFIDDVGSTHAFGRERAQLQDVIRSRVQNKRFTFLTIDNPEFDPDFKHLFKERAVEIYVE
jgi:hypothetical protein